MKSPQRYLNESDPTPAGKRSQSDGKTVAIRAILRALVDVGNEIERVADALEGIDDE